MAWDYLRTIAHNRGLELVQLSALVPNRDKYCTMLLQCRGELIADNAGVRHADRNMATQKFRAFFEHASRVQPDLLITPEYSCPWEVMSDLTHHGPWPMPGAAWVVGCESIAPAQLTALYEATPSTIWIPGAHEQSNMRYFLDPVCILLSATTKRGDTVRVAAVQFKGFPMGARASDIELDHMLRGSQRFILSNEGNNTIQLVVLICSDCMEPNPGILTDLPNCAELPYLVAHIQLNPDPRHGVFSAYRREWGDYNREKMEFICLNWARGTVLQGTCFDSGRSAWYHKADRLFPTPCQVNTKHRGGLYYARSDKLRFHCHLLGYEEHVITVDSPKISQSQNAEVLRTPRAGPEPRDCLTWRPESREWQLDHNPDDGFRACCDQLDNDMAPLTAPETSPIMRERLACLTAGDIIHHTRDKWHEVSTLPSLALRDDESCERVTFTHDQDPAAVGIRHRRIVAVRVIKHEVLASESPFPGHLTRLQGNALLRYEGEGDSLNANVSCPNGDFAATFVYAGDHSRTTVQPILTDLVRALGGDARKLVVWYRDGGALHAAYPEIRPTVDSDPGYDPVSITQEIHL